MKKLMAVILAVVLMFSILPLNVFATTRDIWVTEHYVEDTFVYEFERGESGRFETFSVNVVRVYNDGFSERDHYTAYSNTGVETGLGTLYCTDTQDETPWVAGNTYQVESNFGTFNVEVRETPIASIEIDDVSGCSVDDNGKYYYSPRWRVYYTDGRCEEMGVFPEISIEGSDGTRYSYRLEYIDTQDEEAWVMGNTYEVMATVLGISDTFNVTATTVQDIIVDDITHIVGTGDMNGHYDEEGNYIENSWMQYSVQPQKMTVTFSDGTSISGDYWQIHESLGLYYSDYYSDQSYENQWGIGTHTATIHLFGVGKEYNVIIVPSPIKSIDIQDISIIEGTNGYQNGEYFYYYVDNITATITFNDDTVVNYNGGITIDDMWYNISVDASSQYEEPWTVGNTYEVTGTLLGVSDTFNVTIKPSPVKSIDIQDVSIIEYTDGYQNGEYYHYWVNNIKAKVTLADGTEKDYNNGIEIDGLWRNISVNTEIQYEEPWTVGNTYEVTGTLMGVSDTFNVTITPTPIKSIDIEDISIIEGTNGDYNGEFYYYNVNSIKAKVTFLDGTEKDCNGNIEIENQWYVINIDVSEQYNEPWTVGNTYQATGTLMGVSDTFNVTIVPTPVKSVKFKDITLIDGVDKSDTQYYINPVISKVELKNDELFELNEHYINYGDSSYWAYDNSYELQYEQPWEAGNTYTIIGTLMGVSSTFNVIIVENPIKDIELLKAPDKTEYIMGEFVNLKGLKVRINYKDNTYEDVVIDDYYSPNAYPYSRSYYSKKLDRTSEMSCFSSYEDIGEQTVTFNLFNEVVEIPITVKENLVEQIILKENADKSLTITVYNSDATSCEMKVLSLGSVWINDKGECETSILTDQGAFYCKIFVSDNSFAIGLYNNIYYYGGSDDLIKSNKIPRSEWFEVATKYTYNEYFDCDNFIKKYNGVITSNNIDDIIELSLRFENIIWNEDSVLYYNGNYPVYSAETIKDAVLQWLALEDIDLNLSKYYDPQTNTYEFHEKTFGGGEASKCYLDKISYNNGIWTVITTKGDYSGNYIVETYTLNDEQKILNFEFIEKNVGGAIPGDSTPGDVDGDGNVNMKDYTLVLRAANGWNVEINGDADVDNDGNVNMKDYTLILRAANGWNVELK